MLLPRPPLAARLINALAAAVRLLATRPMYRYPWLYRSQSSDRPPR